MDGYGGYGYGPGRRQFGGGGGNGRLEIVSGKGFGTGTGNQIYASRPGSPDMPHVPPRVNHRHQAAAAAAAKPWGFSDAESKRKRRIAKYKVYTVEGKVKVSLRNGIRWIKNKCSQIIHGY